MHVAKRISARVPPGLKLERRGPFGPLGRFQTFRLRPEDLHPVVRISHRLAGVLQIPERIIFDHELVLITKGEGEWTCGGERRAFGVNDLLFIPPFVPHSFQALERISGEHVAVHFDFAPRLPRGAGGLDRRRPYRLEFTHGLRIAPQRRLFAGHRLARAMHDIVATHGSDRVLGAAQASVHLAGVILALLEETPHERVGDALARDRSRVQAVVSFMTENLARPLDHSVLETVSGLSPSRLQALFHEVTGYPPLEYLRRVRVEEARRLLADSRLSVKEVAARTGFRDTSHFSKVFRRMDGLSPAHFRDALLAGRQEK